MTDKQFRRAKKLIRRLCANYDNGECLPLYDGDACPCPQLLTRTLICKYFRAAVLPDDPELYAGILRSNAIQKQCVLCQKPFIPRSNRALYCDSCARMEQRRKCRERVRRHRGRP